MRPVFFGNAPSPEGDPRSFMRWALWAFKETERASQDSLSGDTSSSGAAIATSSGALASQIPYFSLDGVHVGFVYPGLILNKWTGVSLAAGTTDFQITPTVPSTAGEYAIEKILVVNRGSVGSLNLATAGVFSGAGGTGTTLAADQALAAITTNAVNTNANSMSMTLQAVADDRLNFSTLYFRVGTAQGAGASVDVYAYMRPLP